MTLFKGEFIGLTAKTNNDPLLKDCMRKFKIYASKIEYEEEDDEVKEKPKVNIIIIVLRNPKQSSKTPTLLIIL